MKNSTTVRAAVARVLVLGLSGPALAFGGGGGGGGGDGGSGLNPYSELSGNDRSAGVNNGNYRQPRYNTYLRAYGPYGPNARPVGRPYRPAPPHHYGHPY